MPGQKARASMKGVTPEGACTDQITLKKAGGGKRAAKGGSPSKRRAAPKKTAARKPAKKTAARKVAAPKAAARKKAPAKAPTRKTAPRKSAAAPAAKKTTVAAGVPVKDDLPAESLWSTKRFQSAESQRRYAREMCESGKKIGFVPTMGAFHEGHLALIRRARSQNDIVVVSVFVNTLQFGPGEDFDRYPRDLARDMDLARELEVDAVFVPDVQEMYPPGFATRVTTGPFADKLCGAFRPGHFDGVCTVVMKLLGIVHPTRIYLGEKDAQQLLILQRMISDMGLDVKVVACPTERAKDGLALSSRNLQLSPEDRARAPRIYGALRLAQREILVQNTRDPHQLRERMKAHIMQDDAFDIQYIAMVDPESLEERPVLEGRTLIAIAAVLSNIRLIDNILINVPGGRMAQSIRVRRPVT